MAEPIGNVLPNVNARYSKPELSINVNVQSIRGIAHKLSESLNDPESFEFFCKVARNLPESVIWSTLEKAQGKSRPAAWFSKTCSILMG